MKIEKGIPIPATRAGRSAAAIWNDFEVGDSVLIPPEEAEKATNAAWAFAKRKGIQFTTRKEANGTRVWRIK